MILNLVRAYLLHIPLACLIVGTLMALSSNPGISSWQAAISLLASILVAGSLVYFTKSGTKDREVETRQNKASIVCWVAALLICYFHFVFLFYSRGGDWWTLNLNNYGDLGFHVQTIRYLSEYAQFWPQNPILASESLRYPFFINLYSALWESLGIPTSGHLFLVGVFSSLALLFILRLYYGLFALVAFMLSPSLLQIWPSPEIVEAWKNPFLSMWLTQRGLLYAFPAGLLALAPFWREALAKGAAGRGEWGISLLLLVGLAYFQPHGFVTVSALLGILLLRQGTLFSTRSVGFFLFLGLAIAPYYFFLLSSGVTEAALRWQWNWMHNSISGGASFWLLNLGVWPWLFLGGIYLVWNSGLRSVYFPLFAFFVLFAHLMLAPWDWDNIKILIWPLLLFASLYEALLRNQSRWLRGAVLLCLILPGMPSLLNSLPGAAGGQRIFQQRDLIHAERLTESLPADSVFVVAPVHNHPLAYLGRPLYIGYLGHLWSHAYSIENFDARLRSLYLEGLFITDELLQSGASHIYWGQKERAYFGIDRPTNLLFFAQRAGLRVEDSGEDFLIYLR